MSSEENMLIDPLFFCHSFTLLLYHKLKWNTSPSFWECCLKSCGVCKQYFLDSLVLYLETSSYSNKVYWRSIWNFTCGTVSDKGPINTFLIRTITLKKTQWDSSYYMFIMYHKVKGDLTGVFRGDLLSQSSSGRFFMSWVTLTAKSWSSLIFLHMKLGKSLKN